MRTVSVRLLIIAAFFCIGVSPAFAWNCSNPLAERVPVAAGTTGSFGDGDGQLFTGVAGQGVPGQLYECKVVPPGTTPPPGSIITNTNSNSNSNSNSNTNKNTNTSTNLNNNVATATGGASSVKDSGNSSSTSSVKDSGNSSSTSTIKNSGNSSINNSGNSRQKQTQSQSQSSVSSANGNGDNSNNQTTNVPHEVASAYAPTIYPTVPCFKGFSGGAQAGFGGVSFGGGKIDQNCAALEAARQAPSLIARCKIFLQNKYVKAAGVTMADCLTQPVREVAVTAPVIAPAVPVVPAPIIVEVQPAPVVIQQVVAPVVATPTPIAPELRKKSVKRVVKPCVQAKKAAITNDDIDRLGPILNR